MRFAFLRLSSVGALLFAAARATAAEPTSAPRLELKDPLFRYQTTGGDRFVAKPNYLRAGVEQGIILTVGFAQYATDKGNKADWDLAPSWSAVEQKLSLSAVTFDNNKFDTNWLTHPLAGWAYYSAARSNRLSLPVSFLYAFASSTAWEYIGEIREHAAINDLIATPVTGLALAEPMLQLGGLLHRSSRPGVRTLGWAFAPFKNIHDDLDELRAERATAEDGFGLPTDVWHRVTMGASVGVTHQELGTTQGDARFAAASRIVSIPGYGRAGTYSGWFDGGQVSDLRFQSAVSEGQLVDLHVGAHVLPFGFAAQNVRDAGTGRLVGNGFFAGLHVGAEYGRHDYDRDRRRERDRIALVATGVTLEERLHLGRWTVRARVDGLGNFAGVYAYALPEERQANGALHLTSVLRNVGYYHAYGATVRPRIEAERRPFDAGAELRLDWFQQITGRDVEPAATNEKLDASDRRTQARVWIGYFPTRHMRLSISAEHARREGRVNRSLASRSELGLHAGAEIVF